MRKYVTVILALALYTGLSPGVAGAQFTSINSNFNGTALTNPEWVWFNMHLTSVSGLPAGGATLYFLNQTITITNGSNTVTLNVPDAQLTITPGGSIVATTFTGGQWQTTVNTASNNPFMSGLAAQVPVGVNWWDGSNPVTWSGNMYASTSSITSVSWQWAAAAYTSFSNNYTLVDPTELDGVGGYSQSGTPQGYTAFVTGGARGGGGSNYTGSNSGTTSVTPSLYTPPPPVTVPEPGTMMLLATGLAGIGGMVRRRKVA